MSQQLSAGVSLALAQRGGGGQPSLALNFLTEQLDSRITFSRGTQAMRYGQDGTLQYAPNNLLTYSNQADNAAWTKSNSFVQTNLLTFSDSAVANYVTISGTVVNTTPITGFTNSVRFPDNSSTIFAYKSYTVTASTVYTMSAYVQMDDGTAPVLSTSPLSGDLTLVVNNDPAGATNPTVVAVGGGVYRVYVNYTTAAFSGVNIGVAKYNTQSVKGFKVTGLQLVQGSVPGDYRATTSAALPVLYADYNGALRARKLCEDAANSQHYWSQTTAVTAGFVYTVSFRAKAAEKTQIVYTWSTAGAAFNTGAATFNLSAGTVTPSGAATGTITSLGNGYYLCTTTNTCVTTNAASAHYWSFTGLTTYTGDGSSGIYIADAQLTPGYLPLAVTETTSAAVYGPRLDYDPGTLVTQNLLLYSNDWSQPQWSKTNITRTGAAALGPDGTMSMTKLEATSSTFTTVTQNFVAASTTLTYSIYVKQGSGATDANQFYIRNFTTSTNLAGLTINYSTGAVSQAVGTGATAESFGNGIWRIVMPITSGISVGDTMIAYAGFVGNSESAGEYAYVYGAQINRGSTALPYAATTSSTVQTCAARGQRIEEARTNLLTFSNTFSDASWVAIAAKNVVASSVISPEGVANAWTLSDNSASFEGIQKSVTVAADTTTYAASLYVLKTYGGTSTTFGINLQILGGTTVANTIRINTDTGAVLNGTGAVVQNVGAWWRVSAPITNNASVGNTTLTVSIYPATAAYNTATDSAAATGSATIYQSQLEVGATASYPIITVGSTVTKNADAPSMPVSSSWFNSSAGTIYAEYVTDSFANAPAAIGLNGLYGFNDGGGNARWWNGTTNVSTANLTAAGAVRKQALAYATSARDICLNGGAVASDANVPWATTPTTMYLGSVAGGTGQNINGWLRAVKVYRRRYSITELPRLTA